MLKDPYKYFRVEARELLDGLMQGVLQLEQGGPSADVVGRLLRFAHTLKGAARVVKQPAIAELAHSAEGLLLAHRDSGESLSRQQASELLLLVDAGTSQLSSLDQSSQPLPVAATSTADGAVAARVAAPAPPAEPLESLRVDIGDMDALLRAVTEAGVQLAGVRAKLGPAHRLAPDLERVAVELASVRDVAHRQRLIPARRVFPSLDRSVRDAADTLGRRVAFEALGGDVRLDAHVLTSVRDALMHVVRNAVAHGVEPEAERIALGKDATAHVRLVVERRGGRVVFVCSDDGRGIDVEAVSRAAVVAGVVSAEAATTLTSDRVIALLGTGGLSTAGSVTELSGRGIGLDVVRETALRLRGEMRVRSEPGRGATIEIEVPISIAALRGLVVGTAGALAAIPLHAVRHTVRLEEREITRLAESDSILHEGVVIPYVPLHRMLRRTAAAGSSAALRSRGYSSAVVIQAGNRRVALGVDRMFGISNIVMRPIPAVVEADDVVSGVSLDAEGNPQLVLDPDGLVVAADRLRGAPVQSASVQRAPVLVIDDSLTTRMLEQSILESAGYEVEVASSAEEGLIKAHARPHCLFIVDVDMPGMDGFSFVAETRADAGLRDTPAILVTSRNAPDDKRRGAQAGASAYIVKGEFDQVALLRTIHALIG